MIYLCMFLGHFFESSEGVLGVEDQRSHTLNVLGEAAGEGASSGV